MAKKNENLLALGKERLASKESGAVAEFQHVPKSDFPIVEDLKSLDTVVNSIKEKLASIQNRKVNILEDLLYLHNNWDEYTKPNAMAPYRGEPGLYRFIGDKIVQTSATSYADVRIVRMLAAYQKAFLLKQDGKVNSLKRIAYINDRKDPKRAEKFRKEMLDELPVLTNKEVDEKIDEFNKAKGETKQVHRRLRRPFAMTANVQRGKIVIKEMEPDTCKDLQKLLNYLTADRINELLQKYDESVLSNSSYLESTIGEKRQAQLV